MTPATGPGEPLPLAVRELADDPRTARQAALLGRVVQALRGLPACRGAALVGSFANGRADRVSDLDLVVFVDDGAERRVLDTLESLVDRAAVFYTLRGPQATTAQPDGALAVFVKCILLDFTSFEFHVIGASAPFGLRTPCLELLNRDGCLESRLSDSPAPGHAEMPAFAHGDAGLAWELFNGIEWLHRGEVAATKGLIHRLATAIGPDR